jgi:hypothetical protein
MSWTSSELDNACAKWAAVLAPSVAATWESRFWGKNLVHGKACGNSTTVPQVCIYRASIARLYPSAVSIGIVAIAIRKVLLAALL